MTHQTETDVLILGAGAAGLMAAIAAGRRGQRVTVLDHAAEPGAKILISGGGRCNFTNLGTVPERFWSDNPHFCRSALKQFTPRDFIAMVERHKIAYHEKTLGQLFCDGSARQILRMLLDEAAAAGVRILADTRIIAASRPDCFRVETSRGAFTAPALILATGGLSIPKMGATGLTHDLARQFGLRLVAPRPGLVPLTFDGALGAMMEGLAGVSLPVVASLGKARFAEAMLFTHRGLSGPAILQIASAWREGPIRLDLLPGTRAEDWLLERKLSRPRAELATILGELLPHRLAAALAAPLPQGRIADLPDRPLRALAAQLNRWEITPSGTEGYAKAEVTLGGVDTRDLASRDMQAVAVPGLFVVGEAVDVTGWLGGYNFQWAWSSGWAAGQAA